MATRRKAPRPRLVAPDEGQPRSEGEPAHQVRERWIHIQGFKSLADGHAFALRPLTLLAGANSSGKSSMMQPLLLLKQTLDSSYDPGPLKLHGPHVFFSRADEVLSQVDHKQQGETFMIRIFDEDSFLVEEDGTQHPCEIHPPDLVELVFRKASESSFALKRARRIDQETPVELEEGMTSEEIHRALAFVEARSRGRDEDEASLSQQLSLDVERCYFVIRADEQDTSELESKSSARGRGADYFSDLLTHHLSSIIHVPGIRQLPAGASPPAAVQGPYPGPFDAYTASLIHHWQESDPYKLDQLVTMLLGLGLTSGIEARQPDARQVELWVQQGLALEAPAPHRWVRLNQVGLGVSQVLPVLVALLAATSDHLIYIEQPELHLHPKAQVTLARFLAEAVSRSGRMIVETHSALLLRALQTLIARGQIHHQQVMLHWFERDEQGLSKVTSRVPDADGSYGDWPEDFGDVEMETDENYLQAVEKKLGVG